VAERKLLQLDEARSLADLRIPPQNKLKALRKDGRGSMRFASTTSTGSASSGPRKDPQT
jgi:plasmid maintenance system killer protein